MKNKNQLSQNAEAVEIPIPAHVTAKVAGCSESTVKKVRTNKRGVSGEVGERVALVDDLFKTGTNKLIEEIKRLVRF